MRQFYDDFSRRMLDDYLYGNLRVDAQLCFLKDAVWPTAESILILGCGTGQAARYLAMRVARRARIRAVDLSSESIAIAKRLFPHRHIQYEQGDILGDGIPGQFDVVVLPDVYEHIPVADRPCLHERLRTWLTPRGRILLTLPSPGHQAMLRERGTGLQIVDETVTLADLTMLANAVGGSLTYFALVSVFRTNDYIHAVVERGAEQVLSLNTAQRIALKRQRSPWRSLVHRWIGRPGLLWYPWRLVRLRWALMGRRPADSIRDSAGLSASKENYR